MGNSISDASCTGRLHSTKSLLTLSNIQYVYTSIDGTTYVIRHKTLSPKPNPLIPNFHRLRMRDCVLVSLVLIVAAAGTRDVGGEVHLPLQDSRRVVVDVYRSPNTGILRVLERYRGGKCSVTDDMSPPPHNGHQFPFLVPTTEQPQMKPIEMSYAVLIPLTLRFSSSTSVLFETKLFGYILTTSFVHRRDRSSWGG